MFRLDTLFIEMRANTTDFERGITGVGRELDKLGDFIQKKPVIAASAFASSLLLVGAAATKMAREVDQGIRAATASMPVLQGRTEDMRQEIERLSRETGKSQASLSEAFAAAAKTGVTGFTQLRDVVQSAVRISEATGEDVIAIIGGLDLALDGFNISASRTTEVGAKLFAIAQGRFGFTELTDAIQPIIPAIKSANVGFDEMVGALGNLLDEGYSPKQAAKQLKEFAAEGTNGAAKIRELAGDTVSTAEAMERLRVAAQTNREEAGNLSNILRAQLNAELIDLGNEILPTVNAGFAEAIRLIREFRQTWDKESLFAGNEITLPDTGPQLRVFIEQVERQLAIVERAAAERLRRLERSEGIAPGDILPGVGSVLRAGRITAAGAELKTVTDEADRLSAALSQAKQKLNELRSGDTLPEMTATARRVTDAERDRASKEAERAREEGRKALRDLQQMLVISRATLGGDLEKDLAALRQRLAEFVATTGQAGAEELEEAKGVAEEIVANFLVKAERDLTGRLRELTEREGAAARAAVIREANALLAGREQFDRTVRDNLNAAYSDTVALVKDILTRDERRLDLLRRQADEIRSAAAATGDMLYALGVMDERAASFLDSITSVATGIGPLVDALGSDSLSLSSLFGAAVPVVGGLSGIIGAISSVGEPSPEMQRAIEATREAIAALEENTRAIAQNTGGLLGSSATGSELSRFEPAVAAVLAAINDNAFPEGSAEKVREFFDDILAGFGFSLDDLAELAREFGLEVVDLQYGTFGPFAEYLGQIQTEMEARISRGAFGTDFSGRLNLGRTAFEFTPEVESNTDQFADLVRRALLGDDPSRILRNAFAGIDLGAIDDPAVQEAARAAIRTLFTQVTAEGFSDFEGLGDASFEQFIGFLQELLGLLPDLAEKVVDPAVAVNEALAAFSRSARVFDTSTKDQATQFLNILAGFSPALAELVGQMNPEHIEGLDHATGLLQDFFARVESGEISLEGTGLTVELLVDAIDRLQAASQEAKDEVERLAAEEERRAEELRREAERQREEAEREAQRAQEEARRRAAEADADRIATGNAAIQRLREEFALFDIDDVVDQLQEMAGLLQARGPIFQQLLGGLDLADPTARSEALARLQQFAVQNPLGVSSGTFGAATTRSAALELAEMIKRANEVAVTGGGQSGSFAISRTITEAGADRISGLLGTGNILLGEIAGHTAAIAAALGAPRLPPLVAPSVAFTGAPAVPSIGSSTFHIQIYVNGSEVSGGLSPAGTDAIRQLSQALTHDAARAAMGA